MSRADLARLTALVAGDLDRKGYPSAGVVRQAARALLEAVPVDAGGCRGCGAELDQPATGRPRVWCSEACRRRKPPESVP